MKSFLSVLLGLLMIEVAYAENYYCNPAEGNTSNNGSFSMPWGTLSEAIGAGKSLNPGDTLFLYSGAHGSVSIDQYNSGDEYVVVAAIPGEIPVISNLVFSGAAWWKFIGVDISRQAPATGYNVYNFTLASYLVQSDKNSSHIAMERCNIYTEGVDPASWGRLDWFNGTLNGVLLRGKYNKVSHCSIKNTNFSLEVRGRYTEVTHNTIENFVGDAIRALSSFSSYEYNVVKNSYDVTGYNNNMSGENPDYPAGPGNHDDLLQSYTSGVGGVELKVTDVVIRYNQFFSYTDPDQVDKSFTQAIACFDGYFENWTIENNLIVTDSWHGISLLGVNNSKVTNNTILSNPIANDLVINGGAVDDMTPFIWIGKTKSGGLSKDNVVRNNLIIQSNYSGSGYNNVINEGTNTLVQNNHSVPASITNSYFVDFQHLDFRTKANSPGIDKGINIDLGPSDIDQQQRLIGPLVDCGAYEFDNSLEGSNCPVIDQIGFRSVSENRVLNLEITATDRDDLAMSMEVAPLESGFMSFTDYGSGSGTLTCQPQTGDMGLYRLQVTVSDSDGNSNVQSFAVEVTESTGLDEKVDPEAWQAKLYPNPVQLGAVLTVTTPDSQINRDTRLTIYNMQGGEVYSTLISAGQTHFSIDTSLLNEKGAYLLRIGDQKMKFLVL